MKSGIQGLILAFLGALTIFTLAKNDIFKNSRSLLRFLEKRTIENITDDFCSKSSSDLQNFYNKTGPNYKYTPENGSQLVREIIKDFISNDPNKKQDIGINEVKKYFSDSPLYIFVLVIFVILVLLWIPYILCIWCKRCPCIPESCLKKPKFFVFISLLFCIIVLVNCFVGYTENGSIIDGVFGLGCSILKVEQHLKYGDEYTEHIPYWIGLSGIVKKLEKTRNDLSHLNETAEKIREINDQKEDQLNPLFDNFTNLLEEEYEFTIDELAVSHPNPNITEKMNPYFIKKIYGPPGNLSTCLGNISLEMEVFKNLSFSAINDTLINLAVSLDKAYEEIGKNSIINDISYIAGNLTEKINDIEESIAQKIIKHDDEFNKFSSKSREYINIFFSINLVIVMIVGIALVMLLLCSKGLFILCISWFFMYCLMLLTFFLGAVFGLIGSFTQEASYGVYYLTTNLNETINIDQKVLEISQICLNGNGSLSQSSIVPKTFNSTDIDTFYSLDFESEFDKGIIDKNMSEYNLPSIINNDMIYDQILESINNLPELKEVLTVIRNYIDSSSENNLTNSEIKDKWVINENECDNEYKYISPNNLNSKEDKACLVISEWNYEKISERYKDINSKDNNINIIEQIQKHFNSTKKYLDSYDITIQHMKEKNKNFGLEFNNIKSQEINIIKKSIKDVINPLINSYKDIVGSNSILEILNCQFLKRDVYKIIEELYDDLGKTFQDTSTLLLIISIFELGMTFLILFIMKGFKHMKSKESEEIEKTK